MQIVSSSSGRARLPSPISFPVFISFMRISGRPESLKRSLLMTWPARLYVEKRYGRNRLAAAFIREVKAAELIQRMLLQRIGIHASASFGVEDQRNAIAVGGSEISSGCTSSRMGESTLPSFLKYSVHSTTVVSAYSTATRRTCRPVF